ncbi:hypothetical protein [Lacibacter sp.]|uniref:hypothetical protein n=1 Tax=Lacibacter sp. TaxID=1915409 RepID=UPI002B4ADC04|nr:hypothetical protein [Lacibacter sp.]HLP39837.1 hypothetical protein [Lacibacter sp.]
MKKYLLLFLLLSSTFLSCFRKGEDDPFVSFRSRKARVEGRWKVKTLFVKQVNKYTTHKDEFFQKLENGVFADSIVEYINGAPLITKGTSKRTILYSFSKGGQFEMKDYMGDKDTMILTGTWSFNVRGGGNRHRELIYINIERQWTTFFGTPRYWVLFRMSQNSFLCQLQELRHKKMVWKDDLVETNVNPTGDYLGYERESYIELEPE